MEPTIRVRVNASYEYELPVDEVHYGPDHRRDVVVQREKALAPDELIAAIKEGRADVQVSANTRSNWGTPFEQWRNTPPTGGRKRTEAAA